MMAIEKDIGEVKMKLQAASMARVRVIWHGAKVSGRIALYRDKDGRSTHSNVHNRQNQDCDDGVEELSYHPFEISFPFDMNFESLLV
jgi:hypothetical protein